LYASLNLNVSRAGSVWLPTYGANDGTIPTDYKPGYPYDLWQYTSKGSIAGIAGNVDMNTAPSSRFKEQYLKK
jgi:GH25 family lysozyme M1 (1,4-beta-N-acetylmuramidase)